MLIKTPPELNSCAC